MARWRESSALGAAAAFGIAAGCTGLAGLDELSFGIGGAGGSLPMTRAGSGAAAGSTGPAAGGMPTGGGSETGGNGGIGGGGGRGGGTGGAPTGYVAEVLADEPVGYWRLGESGGTIAFDASGNSNHGTYQGAPGLGAPGALAGDADTAVSFDGIDDVVTVAASAFPIEALAAFSVELWAIRLDDGSGIIGRNDFTAQPNEMDGFMIALAGNGNFRIQRQNDALYPAAPPTGGYFHLVVTYDGTTVRVYRNGTMIGSGASSSAVPSLGYDLLIGNVREWTWFSGRLDEVAVYDKALSDARIMAHYQAGL